MSAVITSNSRPFFYSVISNQLFVQTQVANSIRIRTVVNNKLAVISLTFFNVVLVITRMIYGRAVSSSLWKLNVFVLAIFAKIIEAVFVNRKLIRLHKLLIRSATNRVANFQIVRSFWLFVGLYLCVGLLLGFRLWIICIRLNYLAIWISCCVCCTSVWSASSRCRSR